MISPRTAIDLAIQGLVALLLSSAINLVGAFLGSFALTKLFVLGCFVAYLVVHRSSFSSITKYLPAAFIFVLWLVWPALSSLWTASDVSLSTIGRYFLATSLMATTAVMTLRLGAEKLHRLAVFAFFLHVLGLIASLFLPSVFEKIGELQEDRGVDRGKIVTIASTKGRAIGFQGQANKAAHATAFIALLILVSAGQRSVSYRAAFTLVSIACLLSTGSRGGLLAFVVFSVAYWIWCYAKVPIWMQGQQRYQKLFIQGLFAATIGTVFLVLFYDKLSIDEKLAERFSSLLPSQIEDTMATDRSISGRIEVAGYYLRSSFERPFIGHGVNSMQQTEGVASSHNTFFELVYDFGFIYIGLLIVCVLAVVYRYYQRPLNSILSCNATNSFVCVWAVSWIARNGGLLSPSFCVVLGFYIGASTVCRRIR